MSAVQRFTVMTTGKVEPGFEADKVAADFVDLLQTDEETAIQFVHTEQCVAADIDEARALAYKQSLAEIGLRVLIVPTDRFPAANDSLMGDSSAAAQPSTPKHTSDSENVSQLAAEENNGADLRWQSIDEQRKYKRSLSQKRLLRFLVIALIAFSGLGFLYLTNNPNSTNQNFLAKEQFSRTPSASEEIYALMDAAEITADSKEFTDQLHVNYYEYFESLTSTSISITAEKVELLQPLIPLAFNEQALNTSIANQLQRTTFESDIPGLTALFSSPTLQRHFNYLNARQAKNDSKELEQFVLSMQHSDIPSSLQDDIEEMIDRLGIDTAMQELAMDINRSLLVIAGSLRPDADTPAAKERVKAEIKAMRAEILSQSRAIREEIVYTLVWQYHDKDPNEFRDLKNALDKSEVRSLFRETNIAYEAFLRDATAWLQRQINELN